LFVLVSMGTLFNKETVRTLEIINQKNNMKITSTAFEENQSIPPKHTCDDKDVSPPMTFSDIPEGAKSLALIVDDPDAAVGLWVHWTLWNIPPDTTEMSENSIPLGSIEGITSFGNSSYGGPCPGDGEHRYFFKLYALDIELDLSSESDKEDLEEAMVGHVLDRAELVGVYKRPI